MLRLTRNDIVANSVSLFGLFVLLNGGLVLIASRGKDALIGGTLFGLLIAVVAPLPAILRAEVSKSIVVYRSLPVKIWEIVVAKYLTVFVLFGLTLSYALVYIYIMHTFGLPLAFQGDFVGFRNAMIPEFIFGGGTLAISVPLIFRYGTFMRIIWGILLLALIHSVVFFRLREAVLHGAGLLGVGGLIAVAIIFVVLANAFSVLVSKRLLARKDL